MPGEPPDDRADDDADDGADVDTRDGRQRILDAAIHWFGKDGVAATPLLAIAKDANVSQALIVHHFGSKDRLRAECDQHVFEVLREQLRTVAEDEANFDLLQLLRRRQSRHAPILPYLGRALAEGGQLVDVLVDELAELTIRTIEHQVGEGMYLPSQYPRERALVLLIWSLGAVTLHEQVRRVLGADLTGEPEALLPYLRGATEVFTDGIYTEARGQEVRALVTQLETGATPDE